MAVTDLVARWWGWTALDPSRLGANQRVSNSRLVSLFLAPGLCVCMCLQAKATARRQYHRPVPNPLHFHCVLNTSPHSNACRSLPTMTGTLDNSLDSVPTQRARNEATTSEAVSVALHRINGILQNAHAECNNVLSLTNSQIKEVCSRERSWALAACHRELSSLSVVDKASFAAHLLSSQDFDNEIDFSQLKTCSSRAGILTWTCSDNTLSNRSWRPGESLSCRISSPNPSGGPGMGLSLCRAPLGYPRSSFYIPESVGVES